ncbi:BrnA antitoxin family protein [Roseibium limicola]|uniref:BrnA antitoxin family protein n=1 Tax=Roseibium limicola TaxID=2816037 RepID=A0A939ER72_9HYPH|nr:BrnA antitoxin family protein [Roseibium limicola]MBO0347216.1 BrnA antitoxin family protein [Roseibium limicola]
MAYPPRRHTSAIDTAEALFKKATTKPIDVASRMQKPVIPVGKESVSLRLDNEVLAHFQDEGPGWQDRINAALRKAAGLE